MKSATKFEEFHFQSSIKLFKNNINRSSKTKTSILQGLHFSREIIIATISNTDSKRYNKSARFHL